MNNLGNCYFRLQQFDKAVSTYKQLIHEYSTDGSPSEDRIKGRLYNNLGCCYGKLGYEKLSMNSYNEALKIYGRHAATDTSSLLYNIANVYFNCQMFDVSERYYQQAIL
jgi:tetratricopeptide (TPR) repeat protein